MRYPLKAATGLLALAMAGATGMALAEDMHGRHGKMMGAGDAKVSKADYLKKAEARFDRMDANDDGVVDATDRAAMRKRMHDCMGKMDGDAHGAGAEHQPSP